MTDETPTTSGPERRRFFRIEDRIGLTLSRIPAEDETAAVARFNEGSGRVGLINDLRAMRNAHLPQRRNLENRFPTVAAYIRVLERQIETLALAIDDRDDCPAEADTQVNLSAQGISLHLDECLPIGALVEMQLALFPDRCRIEALGRVVRSSDPAEQGETAIEFTHLREADREAIIRHVYLLQREQLKAKSELD